MCEYNIDESMSLSRNKGYSNGLMAAANFIESGLKFKQWYGYGPETIDSMWQYLLQVLGRENEFFEAQEAIRKEEI